MAATAEAGAAYAQAAPAGPLTLGLGASDWNGDYGAPTNTNIAAVLATGLYRVDRLRLSASLPWMRISSDGAVYAGVDGTPLIVTPASSAVRRVREGVGDLTLGASYLVDTPKAWGVDLDAFARVKLPTAADSTGLSTGHADYSAGVQLTRPFGRFAPFVSVRYRDFGSSASLPLKDGVATSLGASYVFANHVTVVGSYDFAQRSSRFIADSHELTAAFTAPLPRSPVRLTGFAAAGLSSGAADVTSGLSLSLSL